MCTNTSLEHSSGWIKPYPFWTLNHFPVPVAIVSPFKKARRRRNRASVKLRHGTEGKFGCSIGIRKWHAEPWSRTAHTWVGYAPDTRNVVNGRTPQQRGRGSVGNACDAVG